MKNFKATYHPQFLKNLKKIINKNSLLSKKIEPFFLKLLSDPFYPGIKTHKVESRNYGKVFSSRLTGDLRILWKFYDQEIILIFDIGTHNEPYN